LRAQLLQNDADVYITSMEKKITVTIVGSS